MVGWGAGGALPVPKLHKPMVYVEHLHLSWSLDLAYSGQRRLCD